MSSAIETRIDIPVEQREKLIALLNQHLADTLELHSQIKQAHWNVKGPQFYQLHELFDDLAEEVEDHVDEIAERATALWGYSTRHGPSGRPGFAPDRVPAGRKGKHAAPRSLGGAFRRASRHDAIRH